LQLALDVGRKRPVGEDRDDGGSGDHEFHRHDIAPVGLRWRHAVPVEYSDRAVTNMRDVCKGLSQAVVRSPVTAADPARNGALMGINGHVPESVGVGYAKSGDSRCGL
jgi:hypothetical protein